MSCRRHHASLLRTRLIALDLANARGELGRSLYEEERRQLVFVRRFRKVADLRDVDARRTPVVPYQYVSGCHNISSGHLMVDLLAPRLANPSSSSSPQTHVFGESIGMTSPYVLSASLVLPRNTLPSTSIWLSDREWSAWW